MKKNLVNFLCLGAIALVSSVGFTACTDDSLTDGSGSGKNVKELDPDSGVPVNLILNVSRGTADAETRMTSAATQATEDDAFRGIDEGVLIAYALGTDGEWVTKPGNGNGKQAYEKMFPTFNSLISPNLITAANSRRVLELTMPTGSNALLFYGSAPHPERSVATNNVYGAVSHNPTEDVAEMTLGYVQRLDDTMKDENGNSLINKFYQVGNLIAGIYTGLADMGFKASSLEKEDRDFYMWYYSKDEYQIINYDDEEYIKIYNCPKRVDEDVVASYSTENPMPAIQYVAYSTTTDALEPNTNADANYATYKSTKEIGGKTYKLYHAPITWKQYGMWVKLNKDEDPSNNVVLSPLGEKLGESYNSLMTKQAKELRAGSSDATLFTIKDLYYVINGITQSDPTNVKEFVSKQFARRFKLRLQKYFDFDNEGNASWTENFAAMLTSISNYASNAGNPLSVDLIKTRDDITQFPTGNKYGIPVGATLLDITFDYGGSIGDKTNDINYGGLFKFLVHIPNYDLGGTTNEQTGEQSSVTVQNYVYPSELMYFGNSPVRVSSESLDHESYPNGTANWLNNDNWKAEDGWGSQAGHVVPDTRSVAMMHNINYGVAMLETKVKIVPGTDDKLEDNTGTLLGGNNENRRIPIVEGASPFELTGIIIGGQPQKVGWDFTGAVLDEMNDATKWDRLVYDNQIINGTVNKGNTPPTASYTLLLDNYTKGWTTTNDLSNGSPEDQPAVYVALEFRNNTGVDFMGMHNMVRNGGTFYLIGKLDPSTATNYNTISRADTYALPPYTDGKTIKFVQRVFMQDYKTTATFKIAEKSLQKAYVTVPNLSASQVSLGLSVDIKWETGLNFSDVELGK